MKTPEANERSTDIIGFYSCATVPTSFARQMEIERDEARRETARWRDIAAKYIKEFEKTKTK